MTDKIGTILMELCFLETAPEQEARLNQDLGLDSLKMVELILSLEDMFGIELQESDLDPTRLETVEDIYRLVGKYREGTPNAV